MMHRKDEQTHELREKMRGGEGAATLSALAGELPGNLRLFSLITLDKGSSIGYHVHENESELFYFIQGTADVRDDDAQTTATVGDTMVTKSGHGHAVANHGDEPVILLAAIVKD